MSMTCYYLVALGVILICIIQVECRCEKVVQTKLIDIQGYRTRVVLTNACKETSSAVLLSRVTVGDADQRAFIKRYQDSCCCVITSNTRHQMVLEPVAPTHGHPAALVSYRRIESCGCVRCSAANYMEDGLDVEYTDDIFSR